MTLSRSSDAGRIPNAVLTVSLAALMSACTVGPDFRAPTEPAVGSYTARDEGYEEPAGKPGAPPAAGAQQLALGRKISGQWWQLLRSKSLDAVLRQGLADSPTMAAARATVTQAQQTVREANGGLWPQLNFAANASRQRSNLANVGLNAPPTIYNYYSFGPNISYDLDLFGSQRRRIEQQVALAAYETGQLNAAYLTLTGNAVQQAVSIASLRAQLAAVAEIVADDQKNIDAVREQLKVGEATRVDLQSATTQLETDRTQLPTLRQQLSVARHALSVLVGKAPAEWTPPDFDLAEFTLPTDLPVSLPSQLVHQRPDILSAEAQLHAATAAVGVATAQLYPNINLTAAIGQQALSPDVLFGPSGLMWSLGAGLTAPLFHGGALTAHKRAAEAALAAQFATYRQTVVQSFGQVADVLAALAHDGELLAGETRAVASAGEEAKLTRASYVGGTDVTFLQVLDAERQYERARLGYVRAEAQRYLDTAQLFIAMGGGWWSDTTQATSAAGTPAG